MPRLSRSKRFRKRSRSIARDIKRALSLFGRRNRNRNRRNRRRFGLGLSRRGLKSRRRFGKISNLAGIMGNNTGSNDMSQFQIYTGMAPAQMQDHLDGIPTNLRDTFYSNSL